MASKETVAVLGAGGTMGFAMARNLLRNGISVRAWNRSRERAEPLAKDGAQVCDTPADAAEDASVILTMLADADAALGVMTGERGALAAVPPATGSGPVDGVIWLQMSTVGEAGTERCADLAGQHEIPFVDAPVLGTKQPAEQGKLVVLASGPQTLKGRLEPIFSAVGQKTIWAGEAGAGTRLKLITNNWLLAIAEGAAESIALARASAWTRTCSWRRWTAARSTCRTCTSRARRSWSATSPPRSS